VLSLNVLLAGLLLAVAVYAQHRVAFYTAGARKAAVTRAVLAAVGILAGWVSAAYAPPGAPTILAFVQGFGVVHVPAALILFLKRARHEGPS
jgi:hypothetical protein